MKFNIKALEVWAKWFVGNAVTAMVVIGKSPLDFSGADWKNAANAIWLALIPVLIKWANPKDEFKVATKK